MSTKIEWCTETWNPITGCTPISEGCGHCYARRMSQRLKGRYGYPADDPFRVTFHPDRLEQPLRWKKPRMIFVCSMGDLFHDDVTREMKDRIYRVACLQQRHTFLFLTKRPENVSSWWVGDIPNVWIGVTVENNKYLWRIEALLKIPAAVRFISHEPALGPITYPKEFLSLGQRAWIITGGESGSGARPMHPDTPRHDRDQCQENHVPFFFKQWGEHIHHSENPLFKPYFERVGKKKAGRLLDGREWNEYPSLHSHQRRENDENAA